MPAAPEQPGIPDVDAVLTTRELGRMIKSAGIDFKNLPEERVRQPTRCVDRSSGHLRSYGRCHGSGSAYCLRCPERRQDLPESPSCLCAEWRASRKPLSMFPLTVRMTVKPCIAHIKMRRSSGQGPCRRSDYHFIEIMACPGGCMSGGGQPSP